MKVTIDYCDANHEDPESLGVYLDDGTEVGRYCIVSGLPIEVEQERADLERMIQACVGEAMGSAEPVDRTRHGEWKPFSKLTEGELQYAIREPMQVFAGEIQSMAREALELRAAIVAYAKHVEACEGVNFLDEVHFITDDYDGDEITRPPLLELVAQLALHGAPR